MPQRHAFAGGRGSLRAALNVSLVGMDRARARSIFRDLILDGGKTEDVSPNLDKLLEMLRRGRDGARVLAINCLFVPLFARLRDVLTANAACSVRHYFNLGESDAEAAQAMRCMSRTTYLPNYAAFACERDKRNATLLLGPESFCAPLWRRTAQAQMSSSSFRALRAAMHVLPADCGLFAFLERVLGQAMTDAAPVNAAVQHEQRPGKLRQRHEVL